MVIHKNTIENIKAGDYILLAVEDKEDNFPRTERLSPKTGKWKIVPVKVTDTTMAPDFCIDAECINDKAITITLDKSDKDRIFKTVIGAQEWIFNLFQADPSPEKEWFSGYNQETAEQLAKAIKDFGEIFGLDQLFSGLKDKE
jgi:hypothetical protein